MLEANVVIYLDRKSLKFWTFAYYATSGQKIVVLMAYWHTVQSFDVMCDLETSKSSFVVSTLLLDQIFKRKREKENQW